MNELQFRKQVLLRESELHRAALKAELAGLEEATAWIDGAIGIARRARPLVVGLSAVAGLLLASSLKGSRGGGGFFGRLLRWGPVAYKIWRTVSGWRRLAAGGRGQAQAPGP